MASGSQLGVLRQIPTAVGVGVVSSALLIIVAIAAFFVHTAAYSGRVYPGVSVLGADLGGLSTAEAETMVGKRFDDAAHAQITLRGGAGEWQSNPQTLGLKIEATETVRRAFAVGRDGNSAQNVATQLGAFFSSKRVEPTLIFDAGQAQAVLSSIGDEVKRQPQNAGLQIEPGGKVIATASRLGSALDLPKSTQAVLMAATTLKPTELDLPMVDVPVILSPEELEKARMYAQSLISQDVILTASGKSWTLTQSEIQAMLKVSDEGQKLGVSLDEAKLTQKLESIGKDIHKPAQDARLKLNGQNVEIIPGTDGEDLDLPSSRQMLIARVGQAQTIPLVTKYFPGLPAESLADLKAQAQKLIVTPPTMKYGGQTWKVSSAELAEMIVLKPGPSGQKPTIEADSARLTPLLQKTAKELDREPKDARFKYGGGKLTVISESQDGLTLDVAESQKIASPLLLQPGATINLAVKVKKPEVTSASLAQVSFDDVIMDSSTPYAGSIAAKIHNVQLAAERLNGTVVPPGAVFSFNRSLGPATVANGFDIGYGIAVNAEGQMQTVPSEAGGICQVASTLFHSVFWAGYPMVERNWHLYWIPKYGQPPRGLKGLDATVDDVYGVDFQFKNNTENWLAIEANASGGVLTFVLRGTQPDWKVSVSDPRVSNIVRANRELVREPDPTMPVGWSLNVEAAEDGFDVAIDRTVARGDQVVDQWTARAHYRPSRNVVLYGTKGAKPPTATPGKGTGTPVTGTKTPEANTTPVPGASTPKPGTTTTPAPEKSPAATATPKAQSPNPVAQKSPTPKP